MYCLNSIPAYPMWLIVVLVWSPSSPPRIPSIPSVLLSVIISPCPLSQHLFIPLPRLLALPGLLLHLYLNILELLLLYASIIYKRSPGGRVLHTFTLPTYYQAPVTPYSISFPPKWELHSLFHPKSKESTFQQPTHLGINSPNLVPTPTPQAVKLPVYLLRYLA